MRYYVKEPWGETIADSVEVPGKPDDIEEAATDAAQDVWNKRDWWGIAFHSWPITVVVIDDEGQEWEVYVDREDVPHFYSGPPRKAGGLP